MSLGVSPSSSSPLTTHSRPLPPQRHRRRPSYTSSPRSTPNLDNKELSKPEEQSDGSLSPKKSQVNDTMGGLRERSEEELVKASREALEEALREQWQVRDRLVAKLETTAEDQEKLKREYEDLLKNVAALQSRTEEAFNEQGRLEADLEERDEHLERLRKRVSEAERQARESQKRYVEQEQTFDIERQALQTQETHLQERLKNLSSRQPTRDGSSDTSLKDELASMNISHSTLLAKLNTLTKELHELKITNEQLVEENEGWEFLIRERTLNGKLREGGLLAQDQKQDLPEEEEELPRSFSREGSAPLEALDEELEAEMDELHSDLEAQSPIFEDEDDFARDLDTKTRSRGGHLAPPSRALGHGQVKRKGRKSKGENLGDLPLTNNGLDLAAELGRAEVDLDGSEMRVLGKGDEGEALRAEVKQLREENKALTLYCSKIIDRIIASEGFEHILSVDYKTRRGTSRTIGRKKSRTGLSTLALGLGGPEVAPPLQDVMEEPAKIVEEPLPIPMEEKKEKPKTRPLSMMVRAISGPVEKALPTPALTSVPAPMSAVETETKTEKRARRGFSLDFRSLGFGSSAPASPKPVLKPLTLSSRTSDASSSGIVSKSATAARKLEPHAEDEEDRKERHRMEATLKLMGIQRTPSTSDTEKDFYAPLSTYEAGKGRNSQESERMSRGSSDSRGGGRGTPLSRLSSVLGGSTALDGEEEGEEEMITDPEHAEAALKAFDEREAKHVKALSKGLAQTGYTSPPRVGMRRGSTAASVHNSPVVGGGERNRGISHSESVKTLWSMGSSRPNSAEIVLEKDKEGK